MKLPVSQVGVGSNITQNHLSSPKEVIVTKFGSLNNREWG